MKLNSSVFQNKTDKKYHERLLYIQSIAYLEAHMVYRIHDMCDSQAYAILAIRIAYTTTEANKNLFLSAWSQYLAWLSMPCLYFEIWRLTSNRRENENGDPGITYVNCNQPSCRSRLETGKSGTGKFKTSAVLIRWYYTRGKHYPRDNAPNWHHIFRYICPNCLRPKSLKHLLTKRKAFVFHL